LADSWTSGLYCSWISADRTRFFSSRFAEGRIDPVQFCDA